MVPKNKCEEAKRVFSLVSLTNGDRDRPFFGEGLELSENN